MDLFDDMAQIGLCASKGFTYRDGERVHGRGWSHFERLFSQTLFPFVLNLRLKYSEDIFRARLAALGVPVHAPATLETFTLDPDPTTAADDHPITATISTPAHHPATRTVRAKYIVGA
ncbi:pentachlorophenol 4-monooxygenase, partial [Teratosphaeria destructans]